MAAKKKVGPGSDKPEGPAVQADGCQANAPTLQRQWQHLLEGLRAVSPASANLLRTHGQLLSVTETEVQIALGDAWRPLLEPRKALLSELAKGRAIVWVEPLPATAPIQVQVLTSEPPEPQEAASNATDELIDRAAQSLAAAFSGTVLQLDPEVAAVLASELHGAAVAVHHGDQEPLLQTLRRVCRTDAQTEENGTLGSERSEEGVGR
jgi:hypothetical protein